MRSRHLILPFRLGAALWLIGSFLGLASSAPAMGAAYSSIDGGSAHTCAIRTDASAWCWGSGENGQLGDGQRRSSSQPVAVAGVGGVKQISAGELHTCAVDLAARAWCWGGGLGAPLGGLEGSSEIPVQVPGLTEVAEVAAGKVFSCARLVDRTLWCWGSNYEGQLGFPTADPERVPPTRVPSLSDVRSVAAGDLHTCAIVGPTKAVYCWGLSDEGETGSYGGGWTPRKVPGVTNAVQLAMGFQHTCVLQADGVVQCWGSANRGALGRPESAPQTPTVPGLGPIKAIASEGMHTCAVAVTGEAYCWGLGTRGALGNGALLDSQTAVPVSGFGAGATAATGGEHSCAIAAAGAVSCWGTGLAAGLDTSTSVSAIPVALTEKPVPTPTPTLAPPTVGQPPAPRYPSPRLRPKQEPFVVKGTAISGRKLTVTTVVPATGRLRAVVSVRVGGSRMAFAATQEVSVEAGERALTFVAKTKVRRALRKVTKAKVTVTLNYQPRSGAEVWKTARVTIKGSKR